MADRREVDARAALGDVADASAARALLEAEARTSVVNPQGARWLLVQAVLRVVAGLLLLGKVADLADWWGDARDHVPMAVVVLAFAVATAPFWPQLTRAVPRRRGVTAGVPWLGAVVHGGAPESPVAPWPDAGHGYAVLSVAARTNGIDRVWLFDRARLSPALGDATVGSLAARGWVEGGHRWLGSDRLSVPVTVTRSGRRALAEERRRLEVLASFA